MNRVNGYDNKNNIYGLNLQIYKLVNNNIQTCNIQVYKILNLRLSSAVIGSYKNIQIHVNSKYNVQYHKQYRKSGQYNLCGGGFFSENKF